MLASLLVVKDEKVEDEKLKDEKKGAILISNMAQKCSEGDISGAKELLKSVYLEGGGNVNSWFSKQLDPLLSRLIADIVKLLHSKPFSSWDEYDCFFVTRLMTLCGCTGLVEPVEEEFPNPGDAGRCLEVFSKCLTHLPSELYPFTLWLFTYEFPNDSQVKNALVKVDERLQAAGVALGGQVKKHRNRSLCQLRGHLLTIGLVCGKDFSKKLEGTNEFKHRCPDCFAWRWFYAKAAVMTLIKSLGFGGRTR